MAESLAKQIFDAVLPVFIDEAKSERRKDNPWFSMAARGKPLPEPPEVKP